MPAAKVYGCISHRDRVVDSLCAVGSCYRRPLQTASAVRGIRPIRRQHAADGIRRKREAPRLARGSRGPAGNPRGRGHLIVYAVKRGTRRAIEAGSAVKGPRSPHDLNGVDGIPGILPTCDLIARKGDQISSIGCPPGEKTRAERKRRPRGSNLRRKPRSEAVIPLHGARPRNPA